MLRRDDRSKSPSRVILSNSDQSKLFTIEALRGLAALAVAWFHLTYTNSSHLARVSGSFGWLGVEVFFVISGFVIPYSLQHSGYTIAEFPRFIARRFCRLEPPYLVSIIVLLALWELSFRTPGFGGAPPSYSSGQVLSHLFYLIPFTKYQWLNGVYWTLAVEFAFYVLLGIFWPLFSRLHVGSTFMFFCVVYLFLKYFRIRGPEGPELVFLFFMGICSCRYFVGSDKLSDFALFSSMAMGILWYSGYILVAATALSSATVIVFVKIPRYRVLHFAGTISYSLYLLHFPIGNRVLNIGKRFGEGAVYEVFLAGLALLTCVMAATIFYLFIEGPAQRLSRRVGRRYPATSPSPGAAADLP